MKLEFECEKKVNNHTKSKRKRKHKQSELKTQIICNTSNFLVTITN